MPIRLIKLAIIPACHIICHGAKSLARNVHRSLTTLFPFLRHTIQPTIGESQIALALVLLFFLLGGVTTPYAGAFTHWWIQIAAIVCGLGSLMGVMLYRMNPHELTYKRVLISAVLVISLLLLSVLLDCVWQYLPIALEQQILLVLGSYLLLKVMLPYAYRIPLPMAISPAHQYEALYIEPAPMPRMAYFNSVSVMVVIGVMLACSDVAIWQRAPMQSPWLFTAIGIITASIISTSVAFYRATLPLYKGVLFSLGNAVMQGTRYAVICDALIVGIAGLLWVSIITTPYSIGSSWTSA